MFVNTLIIKLYAPWVHSLKEKRMITRSIINKTRNKFNVSVSEIEHQDIHQTITIGVAFIAANMAQSDSISEHIISFIESSTEAEVTDIIKDEYKLTD